MSKPSDFANADVPSIVEKLTLEEAILLTAGVGFWHTHAVERLGVPAIKVSDGPNGLRGNYFFMSTPAKCLPSSTALGSTWDVELIHKVGKSLLAPEAKSRSASIALAPTCNIQRSPLGGRSFESFAEDPVLSGHIAAAYVNGLQEGGIGACIKHFTCNDKENDRLGSDSVVSERALREIYLMPFMITQKLAQPWCYMTAYNRLNGTHCSENPYLLKTILRGEWGYQGTLMSDWFGIYSVDHAINAGLDLEMPGTNKWRSLDLMQRSVQSRKITARTVKERAAKVLELVQKCARGAPEVLDGDGGEVTRENEEDAKLLRDVAAQSIVLLKNDGLLPLKADGSIKKIAVVGGNAKAVILSGGGSAALKPSYFVSPYQGIVQGVSPGVEVIYAEGARAYMQMPLLDYDIFTADGKPGWIGTWYAHESDESMVPLETPFKQQLVDETRCFISIDAPKGLTRRWTLRLKGQLKPRAEDCEFEFGLCAAGRAKLFVDDKLVIDNWTRQKRGDTFFNAGSVEEYGSVHLKAAATPTVFVEFCNVRGPADGDEDETVMDSNPGVRLGGAPRADPDELMAAAVRAAEEADVVVAVVGLNADWETEGYDRKTLALPGRTDELVQKVVRANPRTVVVTQSGSSITMPWVDTVPAILHSWYLGNSTGDAIADVLFGRINPAAKLSLSFPKRLEDVASFGHFTSENGKIRYAEDLFVGYKHHLARKITPLFAFGHGLSYTTFTYSGLELSKPSISKNDVHVEATVTLTNTGSVPGSEVVQLYISLTQGPDPGLSHPPLALKAFAKARDIQPGESRQVKLSLDKYAVSYWEERIMRWVVDKGEYLVLVGPSSEVLPLQATFALDGSFEWNGL